jgi:hypothetical protein
LNPPSGLVPNKRVILSPTFNVSLFEVTKGVKILDFLDIALDCENTGNENKIKVIKIVIVFFIF